MEASMFCTKCGKELQEGDRFCAYCGAEVRNRIPSRNDEVVFNPPFKIEAQKKTEEILRIAEERKQQERASEKAKRENLSFDWNLDGFPKDSPRKTEDVNFDWDSVLDRRNRYNSDSMAEEPFEPRYEPVNESLQRRDRERIRQIEEEDLVRKVRIPQAADETRRFNWNLDDYRFEEKKPESPAPQAKAQTLMPSPEKLEEDEVLLPEELEKELFEEMSQANDDRFKTFNRKNSEFQELLDREKQRVQSLEEEYNRQLAEMDYTWVPDVFPGVTKKEAGQDAEDPVLIGVVQPQMPNTVDLCETTEAKGEAEAPKASETAEASEAAKASNASELSEAEASAKPAAGDADAIEPKDENLPFRGRDAKQYSAEQEGAEQESAEQHSHAQQDKKENSSENGEDGREKIDAMPKDKTKLRYSDIFPRVDNQGSSDNTADSDADKSQKADAYQKEEPVKKHIFLKILLTILIIAIVVEGAVLGIKFFAPESKASQAVDSLIFKAADVLSGIGAGEKADTQDGGAQGTDADVEAAYMSNIVSEKSAIAQTIGEVVYSPDLVYTEKGAYSFEEIATADKFVDAEWEGTTTYGQALIDVIIKYYDGWLGTNTDPKLVGINRLEIGEIRSSQSGFYTLCRITYAGSDGNEVTKLQTVYAKVSDGMIVIDEVKEESV